ncbi:MAG: glutamate--tRNA ligase [Pseudomonadota bacterium]
MSQIVTRFAPSPTGYLHIGGARTALFCWLFARHHGGRFVLRIEDTDRARSTPEATQAILDGLTWLGLDWDGDAVSQFERAGRHAEVAHQLLAAGKAYKCFETPEETAARKDAAKANGPEDLSFYRSPWRDTDAADHPDLPFTVRIKAPDGRSFASRDEIKGEVAWGEPLDDMVLLRADGTPVYMLAVVVDDFEAGVSHVIRGDDHLANMHRQNMIYDAMGWPRPVYAHIPLIHGPDGKKLSKRHGALGVMEYAHMGIPAPAMRNYLARLGWSHGDDELFTDDQAREWFGLDGIGKSPARLDLKKLGHVTAWHIARMEDADLVEALAALPPREGETPLSQAQKDGLIAAMYCLKDRARSLYELRDKGHFVLSERPISADEKAAASITPVSRSILSELTEQLQHVSWHRDALEAVLTALAQTHALKFGELAAPMRAALAGRSATPSVYDMLLVLGREESVARLRDAAEASP